MRKKLLRAAGARWFFGLFGVLLANQTAFAQANPAQTVSLPNPLAASSFTQLVGNITGFLYWIAVPLTAIMALIGGFQMVTANGEPEKFSKGRKTLLYAAIGFAVVVLAGGVVGIIKSILGSH